MLNTVQPYATTRACCGATAAALQSHHAKLAGQQLHLLELPPHPTDVTVANEPQSCMLQ
jgi:hypothetical protein